MKTEERKIAWLTFYNNALFGLCRHLPITPLGETELAGKIADSSLAEFEKRFGGTE